MERNFLAVCRFICHTECFIVMWYSANNLVYFLFKDYVNYATEDVPLPGIKYGVNFHLNILTV